MNSYCSFCASAGIKGPHDHFLRASRDVGAPVCCPKLLATECTFCHHKGHTIKFCGAKREQQMLAAQARAKATAIQINSGAWMCAPTRTPYVRTSATEPSRANDKMPSRFAALDMESSSSDDEEDAEQVEVPNPSGDQETSTWARVVRVGKPKEEDEDEKLPPLIFGRKATTRWADEE